MHRIQRAPQRVQRFIRRRQNLLFAACRMFRQPAAPRCPVRLVRFLVHRKIREPLRLLEPVEFPQALDLRRRRSLLSVTGVPFSFMDFWGVGVTLGFADKLLCTRAGYMGRHKFALTVASPVRKLSCPVSSRLGP